MRTCLFVLLFALFSTSSNAQLLDSLALDTVQTYHSVKEALKAEDLSKVYKLDLHRKRIRKFPQNILKFKNLQYLDLGKNKLKTFPIEICQLTNLQFLSLEKNKEIDSIPPCIIHLGHLKKLILNRTEITDLPPQIGQLHSLEYLDLWGTAITHFPRTLKNLKQLKKVDMRVVLYSDEKKQVINSKFPDSTKVIFTNGCDCTD